MSPDNPSERGIREGEPPILPRPFPAEGLGSRAPLARLFSAAVAVWLGGAIAQGFSSQSGPTVAAPGALPLIIFAFFGVPTAFVSLIPAAAMLAWQPGVWQRMNVNPSVPMPIRTWVLLAVVSLLSFIGFVAGWEYGLQYQGVDYTWKCALISTGLALTSATLLGISAWTKDFQLNVLGHAALFYWIASYAFPYLGELL